MPAAVVSDPNAITPEWLTQVLLDAGFEGARVNSFEQASIGTGQVGENVRFELSGDNVPATVVGKFPSDDPVSRATGVQQNNYTREVFYYQTLQPTVDIQTPAVHYAEIAQEPWDFAIIMEDLAPGVQGDQLAGCDADQAALALEQLAKLQGPRWGDPTLEEHELLQGGASKERQPEMQALYKMLETGFLSRYEARLSDEDIAVSHQVGEQLATYHDLYEGAPGLVHVDYRLDNMMFGGPYPLAVVDWQSISLGCPVADASYFLGTSLSPEARASEEQHLLRLYLDVLKSYGVTLSYDHCFACYRNYAPAGLIMAVIASMIVGETERGNDMFMAMATRSAAMCRDLWS